VVAAIFSIAIFACLCAVWRHRFQRRTRDRMLSPRDDAGQGLRERPRDHPTMSMLSNSTISFTPTYRSDTLFRGINAGAMPTGNTMGRTGPLCDGPFSDYFAIDRTSRGLTGLTITANSRIDSPVSLSAPSTPSIYPPSLPPMEIDNDVARSVMYSTPLSMPSINPPPRPPRRKRPPPPPSGNLTETAAMPLQPNDSCLFCHRRTFEFNYTPDSSCHPLQ
jgi:hypothetical protein